MSNDTYTLFTPEESPKQHRTPPPFVPSVSETVTSGPDPKRKKRAWQVTFILLAVFTAICIITGVTVSLIRAHNDGPVWRTIRAVIPGGEMLETLVTVGGDIQIQGGVAGPLLAEFSGVSTENIDEYAYLKFNAWLQYNSYGEFHAYAGLSDHRDLIADADLLFRGGGIQLDSETFLDNPLGTSFSGLAARLENSLLAPDSGSDYALDESAFAELLNMARTYDPTILEKPESGISTREIELVLRDILDRVNQTLEAEMTVTEARREVKLLDGTTRAKVHTYTFSETLIFALVDTLRSEWNHNEALEELVRRYLRSGVEQPGMSDEAIEDALDIEYRALTERLYSILDDMESAVENYPFTCTVEAAVKSQYLVSLTVTLAFDETVDEEWPDEWTLAAVFTSHPKNDPSFDISLRLDKDELPLSVYSAVQTVTEDSSKTTRTLDMSIDNYVNKKVDSSLAMTASFVHRNFDAYDFNLELTQKQGNVTVTLMTLSLEGVYKPQSTAAWWSVEYMELAFPVSEEDPLAFGDESFILELYITPGMPAFPAFDKKAVDPTIFNEAEAHNLEARVTDAWEEFTEDLQKAMYGNQTPDEAEGLPNWPDVSPDSPDLNKPADDVWQEKAALTDLTLMDRYAVDDDAGIFFVLTTAKSINRLHAYSTEDFSLLYEMDVHPGPSFDSVLKLGVVSALDADNGILVVAYQNDPYIQLYDAKTGQRMEDIYIQQADTGSSLCYINSAAICQNMLYCTISDSNTVLQINLAKSARFVQPLTSLIPNPILTVDHAQNLLCISEQSPGEANFALYDAQFGMSQGANYVKGLDKTTILYPHLLGNYLSIGGQYYDTRCEQVTDLIANINADLPAKPEQILRVDPHIHAYTVLADDTGRSATYIFSTVNGKRLHITKWETQDLIPVGYRTYIALETYGQECAFRLYIMDINATYPHTQ